RGDRWGAPRPKGRPDTSRFGGANGSNNLRSSGKLSGIGGTDGTRRPLGGTWWAGGAGTPPKCGVNWASSLELAFRAISWIWGLYFFKTSPSLTEATFWRALKFLYLHGRHIETFLSTYSGSNTHLTGEALGLPYFRSLLTACLGP